MRVNAYMQNNGNSKGFTLLNALFSLFILLLILQFLPIIMKQLSPPSYERQNPVEVYQFFHFLRDELYQTDAISLSKNGVNFLQGDGRIINIDLYHQLIRQRVNNRGYEVLLHDVKSFSVSIVEKGIYIQLTTKEGKSYEKRLTHYKL